MATFHIASGNALARIGESPPEKIDVVEDAAVDVANALQSNAPLASDVMELTSSDDDVVDQKDIKPTNVKQEFMVVSSSGEEEVPARKPVKAVSKKRGGYKARRVEAASGSRPQEAIDLPHSGDVDAPQEPSPRKTRSSNGIKKKRMLQDAALVSEDDELPATITPTKRPRISNAKAAQLAAKAELAAIQAELATATADLAAAKAKLAAQKESDEIANAVAVLSAGSHVLPDAVEGGLLPAAKIIVSVSPLNLGAGKVTVNAAVDDDDNPFLSAPISSLDKGKGKESAYDPFLDPEVAARHFADEADEALRIEDEIMAVAIQASRDAAENVRAGSSSSFTAAAAAGAVDADKAVTATANIVQGNSKAAVSGPLTGPGVPGPLTSAQFSVNVARKTFKDVIAPTRITPMLGTGPVLGDYLSFQVTSLPDVCAAFSPSSQDPFLRDDYPTLPNLKHGILKGWGDSETAVNVWFSKWSDQCPNTDFETALAAVRFARRGNMINPSRASPLDVYTVFANHEKRKSTTHCNGKVAICLTPILSKECYLYEPTTTGLKNKYISGFLHHQEYQRFVCFACTVFDRKSMVGQLDKQGALSFSTMGNFKGDRESSSPTKPPRNPGILSDVITPGIKQKPVKNNTYFKTVLNYTDEGKFPVYDARGLPFNFDSDLDDIASHLPLLGEEIPCNSFVVVGYTLGQYEKDGRSQLATNILFAILLGTEYDS